MQVGRDLHLKKDHPLGIIKEKIETVSTHTRTQTHKRTHAPCIFEEKIETVSNLAAYQCSNLRLTRVIDVADGPCSGLMR